MSADHLLPGDRIRRGGRTMQVARVAVTHGDATELLLRSAADSETVRVPPDTIVAVVL